MLSCSLSVRRGKLTTVDSVSGHTAVAVGSAVGAATTRSSQTDAERSMYRVETSLVPRVSFAPFNHIFYF